jgi:hypothetical protein
MRSKLPYALILFLALLTCRVSAEDLILLQCKALIDNPRHRPAAREIAKYAKQNPDAEITPLLIGGYALTQLLQGNMKAYQASRKHLKKRYPDSSVREQTEVSSFIKECRRCEGEGRRARDCSTCAGSGNCQRCDGKGTVTRDSFEGRTRQAMCLVCRNDKKCDECDGRRQFLRTCRSCGGRGEAFDEEDAEAALIKIMRQVQQAFEDETAPKVEYREAEEKK